MNPKGPGIVYLVGAGPGDPDLITVRGQQVLQECHAVVFDNLIPDELLVTLPSSVEMHYVGKRSGHHSLPQGEINDLLVRLASRGARVVRLKGGDPFVFGRGAEEAAYLREHGIPFEVVPGITAAVGALSYAGIPCTDRGEASYVMFLTGHQAVEKAVSSVPWDWVAGARKGTLVIYMGVAEIRGIVDQLAGAGMPPDTPCAVIERGTHPTQRVRTSQLEKLPSLVAREGIRPPALFVVGGVTRCHRTLDWFGDQPLSSLRVMVTRSADQAPPLYRQLRRAGAEVLAYPTVATAERHHVENWDVFERGAAGEPWLVFSNENGVRYFMDRWQVAMGDIRRLAGYRVAALGHGTVEALQARHIVPDFVAKNTTPSALADEIARELSPAGTVMIRVTGSGDHDVVQDALYSAGAEVVTLPVYEAFPIRWPGAMKDKLFAYPPHVILFTSRVAVEGLCSNLEDGEVRELCRHAAVVSIGPATSAAIRSRGMRVELESQAHSVSSIIDELSRHYSSKAQSEAV